MSELSGRFSAFLRHLHKPKSALVVLVSLSFIFFPFPWVCLFESGGGLRTVLPRKGKSAGSECTTVIRTYIMVSTMSNRYISRNSTPYCHSISSFAISNPSWIDRPSLTLRISLIIRWDIGSELKTEPTRLTELWFKEERATVSTKHNFGTL